MARTRKEKNRRPNSVSSSPTTGKNICDIPTDLINEILLSLDPETLCRLRCVSKWWNDHISSSAFCLLHYHRSLNRGYLRLLQVHCNSYMSEPSKYNYDFSTTDLARPGNRYDLCTLECPEKIIMDAAGSSSCFGLITMSISKALYLFNPTTRSIVTELPPLDYSICEPKLALGFAHSTNQFKVVCFCFWIGSGCNYCRKNYVDFKVLTIPEDLSTGWRAVPSPKFVRLPNLAVASSESAVYALRSHDRGLFRFDLESERWSSVKLPPPVRSFHDIGEFEGSLCLVGRKSELRDEIWLLRDGNVWVKKWVLNKTPRGTSLIPLRHDRLKKRAHGTSLIPLRNDGENGRILTMTLCGMLKFYQIAEGVFEEVDYFFEDLQSRIPYYSVTYVETVASLTTLCDISAAKY